MSIEKPHYQPESYPEEQMGKWRRGAENFALFWEDIGGQANDYDPRIVGPLQAMFLGEKPAVFHSLPISDHKEELKQFGFESIDNYIYDPEQVAKIMKDHPDEFERHNLKTSEEVMVFLDKTKPEEHSVIRGLVLGFPYEAVKNYDKADSFKINNIAVRLFELLEINPEDQIYLELNYFTEKRAGNGDLIPFFKKNLEKYKSELNISDEEIAQLIDELQKQIKIKGFGAYGVVWTDSGGSKESVAQEKRIRDAFEKSGILNTSK